MRSRRVGVRWSSTWRRSAPKDSPRRASPRSPLARRKSRSTCRGCASSGWLGQASTAFPWLIFVAIFVSLPFTTYAILAGHSSIPDDVHEAAKVDGASPWRAYWTVTFPMLRPAIVVATLINIMNVFNSFPIIWAMTHGQPGYSTATTTVFMYILKGSNIGESAAMSVINFGIVALLTAVFLTVSGWRAEVE